MKPTAASTESVLEFPLLPAQTGCGTGADAASTVLALFDRRAPQLVRYVKSLGLGHEDAEDVVQETFLALFRHIALGRDQSQLIGWLFQVAHNQALKRHRTRRRRPAHTPWSPTLAGRHVDPAPDPERTLVDRERRRTARAVVAALSDRERRCLRLRTEGLTYRDIAAALRISLGAVAKSLTRATMRLMNADGG